MYPIGGTLALAAGSVCVDGSDPGGHVRIAYMEQHADINWRFRCRRAPGGRRRG